MRFLVNAAALAVATLLLPGITLGSGSTTSKIITLLIVAVIFGVLNAAIKPIFKFVTAPLIFLTLGLFLLVINGLLLMLTSWISGLLGQAWHVSGFWTAVLGSIIVSIVSFVLTAIVGNREHDRR